MTCTTVQTVDLNYQQFEDTLRFSCLRTFSGALLQFSKHKRNSYIIYRAQHFIYLTSVPDSCSTHAKTFLPHRSPSADPTQAACCPCLPPHIQSTCFFLLYEQPALPLWCLSALYLDSLTESVTICKMFCVVIFTQIWGEPVINWENHITDIYMVYWKVMTVESNILPERTDTTWLSNTGCLDCPRGTVTVKRK